MQKNVWKCAEHNTYDHSYSLHMKSHISYDYDARTNLKYQSVKSFVRLILLMKWFRYHLNVSLETKLVKNKFVTYVSRSLVDYMSHTFLYIRLSVVCCVKLR